MLLKFESELEHESESASEYGQENACIFGWKYIFQAIFADPFGLDLNVFFEENLEMGLFLLSAIYLHVNKD